MLANVPLVITASFPLRAPYELNSRGVRLGEKPSIGRDHIIVDGKLLLILNFNQCWVFFIRNTVCSAGTWRRR